MTARLGIGIVTYNRRDILLETLNRVRAHTSTPCVVVVADDGSGPQTRDMIRAWMPQLGVPLKHVWQEDRGFRLAEIRNRAIAASAGRYLIFLDGDCLARQSFVAMHRRLAETGYFVGGNRVLLSKRLSEDVLARDLPAETWDLGTWAVKRARGDINRVLPLMDLGFGSLRKRLGNAWEGVRGGNFAFFRSDLERVDGFEMSFVGWGLEDSDLVIRMIRSGVKRKDGRFATGVLHLWHPEADRSQFAAHRAKLDELLESDRVRALCGLSALGQERGARVVSQ